jgi:hypothetical protein
MALNAPVDAVASYAPKETIQKLKTGASIIFSTLRFPQTHAFIVGKPEVQETITAVEPVFAKLGPAFKADSQKISQWIKEHQKEVIQKIEHGKDIFLSEIPGVTIGKNEGLVQGGYIQTKQEIGVKGKKGSTILSFDGFYLELQRREP